MNEANVKGFFGQYEALFNRALDGNADMDGVAAMYTSEFIAASPAGVMGGRNDDQFKQAMVQNYECYRAIGTKKMRMRDLRLSP